MGAKEDAEEIAAYLKRVPVPVGTEPTRRRAGECECGAPSCAECGGEFGSFVDDEPGQYRAGDDDDDDFRDDEKNG